MTTRSRQQGTGPSTAADYERAQREEWTQYRANVALDYFGVRAYNVGDPVPASVVGTDSAAGQWVDPEWVDKVGDQQTYEGSATVVSPEPPTIDPTTVAAPQGAAVPDPNTTTEG